MENNEMKKNEVCFEPESQEQNNEMVLTGEEAVNKISVPNMNVYPMDYYIDHKYREELDEFSNSDRIMSGFENLDNKTALYPGLYSLGAQPSIGKTTFALQMSDQIAKSGNDVLFFSLEQTTLELVTKSISREMVSNKCGSLSSLNIRKGDWMYEEMYDMAVDIYRKYASHITIVEGSFKTTITDIVNCIKTFIRAKGVKPVVVIDYLQVIRTESVRTGSTREVVENNLTILKDLQKEFKIVMIVISALNRANYLNQIDYESFKETGGIEYSSDVIWGLQLGILSDEDFIAEKNISVKRTMFRNAKAAVPRKIELVCLKNRFGASSYQIDFDYFPMCDRFVPVMDNEEGQDTEKQYL